MEVRDGLRYSRDHEWVRVEGGEAVIGITDYAQEQLSDIVYVELPAAGGALRQGEPFGSVEAVKAVADLYAPLSGEVRAVNEALADDPALVNRSAFDDGWMVRLAVGDAGELDRLLSPADYRKLLSELEGAAE
ncbi:MAG: glycine cleavage system protein GcvH [Candidatus Eisenbacteria bacterium]|uniref:Glycine cleavage system H protein n=1 Tax=Eiseniibacteriota bacterium TaxID=2212470 RepID=A0A937X986_UNCEI|nr:glycine cleavage system protein GcvH [Candidatus Eisenbacteria bacterium]